VGWGVERLLAGRATIVAPDETVLDLRDEAALRAAVRIAAPAAIVNAAGYTAVDRAEEEPDVAHAVNTVAPGVLAEEAARAGALFVHYSTDCVFDGALPGGGYPARDRGTAAAERVRSLPPDRGRSDELVRLRAAPGLVGARLPPVHGAVRLPPAPMGGAARGDDGGGGRTGVNDAHLTLPS